MLICGFSNFPQSRHPKKLSPMKIYILVLAVFSMIVMVLLSCETEQPEPNPKGYWSVIESEMSAPHYDVTLPYYDGQVVKYYDKLIMYQSIEYLGIETNHSPGTIPDIKKFSRFVIDTTGANVGIYGTVLNAIISDTTNNQIITKTK